MIGKINRNFVVQPIQPICDKPKRSDAIEFLNIKKTSNNNHSGYINHLKSEQSSTHIIDILV